MLPSCPILFTPPPARSTSWDARAAAAAFEKRGSDNREVLEVDEPLGVVRDPGLKR